ncbi:hypothetical protein [Microbispora triticiradicis]|nr:MULTISPECIES: hypothetical protein [Microbispora]
MSNFNLDRAGGRTLFGNRKQAAENFMEAWSWDEYLDKYRRQSAASRV